MDITTTDRTRNVINSSTIMNPKPEGLSSYIRGVNTQRPTYWDFKPSYRAVNSPGLHLYQNFRKVGKPWPPVIPPGFEGRHIEPQVRYIKQWSPALPPGFKPQDRLLKPWPPIILPCCEYRYTEPQDKSEPIATRDGALYGKKETFFLPPRAKIAGNTTKGPPPADDSNPYNIDRWWIRGEGKKEEKEGGEEGGGGKEAGEEAEEEETCEASSAYTSASAEEEAYSNITQLHHPRPQRSTSAEVTHLEIQASMQTPSLNFAATPPLGFADEVRPCVRSSRILLVRALRTRLEDARKATVQEQKVDLIDLSEGDGLEERKNVSTRGPLVDLLGCLPSPRLEAQNSDGTTVAREPQVDLISFSISTSPPHTRTIIPHYQQIDLLSMDSSPLLRFNEANDTPQEITTFLNFRNDNSGTIFIYQSPQKTPLKQALTWGLPFFFFVGLARLISKAEGVELWMLVLALGFGNGVLTRVR